MGEIEVSAADLAVLTYNVLRGKEFPKVSSTLRDLADQARQVIGTAEMLGVLDAECMTDVIAMAMETAYDVAESISKPMEEPTQEEVDAWASEPENQVGLGRAKVKVEHWLAKLHFADSLAKVIGASRCCWRGWKEPGRDYAHVVLSCLWCGAHEHGYPDVYLCNLTSWWGSFTLTHGRCA